ncbi:hypothetical protein VTK26DRAFT_5069 [Humicola hyalothermophila]
MLAAGLCARRPDRRLFNCRSDGLQPAQRVAPVAQAWQGLLDADAHHFLPLFNDLFQSTNLALLLGSGLLLSLFEHNRLLGQRSLLVLQLCELRLLIVDLSFEALHIFREDLMSSSGRCNMLPHHVQLNLLVPNPGVGAAKGVHHFAFAFDGDFAELHQPGESSLDGRV